jgi:hypothetical protein
MSDWTYYQWGHFNDGRLRPLIVQYPYYCRTVLDYSLTGTAMNNSATILPAGLMVNWHLSVTKDMNILLTADFVAAEQEKLDILWARVVVCLEVWEELNAAGQQRRFGWEYCQAEMALELTITEYTWAYAGLVQDVVNMCSSAKVWSLACKSAVPRPVISGDNALVLPWAVFGL